MVSLIDIAPAAETVTIRGEPVEVCGVGALGIAQLLSRFPELRRMFSGRDVELEKLIALGGEVVQAIIAAGTGEPGNPEAERAAGRLNIEEQLALLEAILRATLPSGIGPFVERLTALGGVLGIDDRAVAVSAAASAGVPPRRSPKPSRG